MATTPITPGNAIIRRVPAISWGSIFAGTFVFLAIEVTFGLLGMAIFATAANPRTAHPVGGMSVGIGIWTVVLSIVALYFAGKCASRLSGAIDRNSGLYHGLVTFGMSIFAVILVAALTLGSTVPGNASLSQVGNSGLESMIATSGWWIFIACLLGMIAAITGGTHGASPEVRASVADIDRERNLRAA
jgi:hypothetical protein